MIQASGILHKNLEEVQVEPEFERRLRVLIAHCRRNLPRMDEKLIRRAFLLSYWAHRNETRASGDPFISHPLEVATIVAKEIGLDDMCVAAALLHDVVEDTDLSLDLVRDAFGETLASIIDGLTKISDVFESRELGHAENVKKLMLSMASDVRVILVKFADRLHNMRTLGSLPKEKQFKIASETMDLFAPLAHRFGLFNIKNELEDLSLKVLNSKAYYEIVRGLQSKRKQREMFIERFLEPVEERLCEAGFRFNTYGRPKSIYSIYRKMRKQDKSLDEIYDLFAVRIVLESVGKKGKEDCWRVYSIITDLYKPLPERFRDFISVPKSNGYQSLHTTVFGPDGKKIEVQIRTREMHEVAERGFAAHWKYKEEITRADSEMDNWFSWVRELLENPHPERATEFVKDFRLNLYDEEIYVFTPQGDLKTLPRGATPIDFAFDVHTEIGMQCIGAKVNGKMVPLSHVLNSGDQVEIITSRKQTPNADWMRFVVTQKAKSRIRHWINEKRRKALELGRETWEKKARRANLEVDEQELHRYVNKLKFPNTQQLFYEIGIGQFDVDELISLAKNASAVNRSETGNEKYVDGSPGQYEEFIDTAQEVGHSALVVDGEIHTDMVTHYATCCNPIPGDDVFGYISRGSGIKIHRVNCRNATNLLINFPDRIIPVEWSRQKNVQFIAALRIVGEDRVGIVSDITTVISKNLKTNIRSITVDTDDGIFEGTIVLHVSDLEHLRRLIERIRRIEGIHGVYRFEE